MTMLLEHKNIVIFSSPRTGTKLLAKILEDFGYHNRGEWFSVLSTEIKDDKPVRREHHLNGMMPLPERQFKYLGEFIRRNEIYKRTDKSVVTIWPEYLLEFPFMLYEFGDYHWVCVRRDPWQQMLSWVISGLNANFDGTKTSVPINFNEAFFRKTYWDYYKVCGLQDWLVSNKSATIIDFDELISGKSAVFGEHYSVKSLDEHASLESLVENLDEVKQWFTLLEENRLSFLNK